MVGAFVRGFDGPVIKAAFVFHQFVDKFYSLNTFGKSFNINGKMLVCMSILDYLNLSQTCIL